MNEPIQPVWAASYLCGCWRVLDSPPHCPDHLQRKRLTARVPECEMFPLEDGFYGRGIASYSA